MVVAKNIHIIHTHFFKERFRIINLGNMMVIEGRILDINL